jgi:hypothetical protein
MVRIINETIRTEMGMKKNIVWEIYEQQLKWYSHVMQMENFGIARQVAEWNPQGKQRHSRSVNILKDGFRDSMQSRNLKDEECFDQELWRKNIMSLC